MRIPVGFAILRQTLALRHYRLYVFGNITSNLGMWTQRVAMGWLTWELTHSTTWLGNSAICEAGPALLIGIFAGTVIDRVDQFRLLRLAQSWSLIFSGALAILTLTKVIDIWMLQGLMVMRGVVIAFYRPARMTVIYGLVGREFLPSALYKLYASIGQKPDEPAELAWEPGMMVAHALRALGTGASADQIRDFLVHLKGYAGIDGIYDFEKVPQRGLDVSNAVVTSWNKDAKTWQVVSKPAGEPLP